MCVCVCVIRRRQLCDKNKPCLFELEIPQVRSTCLRFVKWLSSNIRKDQETTRNASKLKDVQSRWRRNARAKTFEMMNEHTIQSLFLGYTSTRPTVAKRFSRSHKGFDGGLPPPDDDAREGDDGSGSVQKQNWRNNTSSVCFLVFCVNLRLDLGGRLVFRHMSLGSQGGRRQRQRRERRAPGGGATPPRG